MKSQKLIIGAATACLLVGTSGAAMAVDTCEDGTIQHMEVDEIVVTDRSCFIDDVFVSGNITATGGEMLQIVNSHINGSVTVTGFQNALVNVNEVLDGFILVEENTNVWVSGNRVDSINGTSSNNIAVNSNEKAEVNRNISDGDIECDANGGLIAWFNVAGGALACNSVTTSSN
jgi:hypothetical protein